MKALAEVVQREDPHTRFVPTPPSEPSFSGDAKNFGKGIHHDTHGPWNWTGSIDEWKKYWQQDDSLMRSEVGMPGTSPMNVLEQFRGEFSVWPPDHSNPYWVHSASWWLQWDQFKEQSCDDLKKF